MVVTDTQGLILRVAVVPADVQDRDAAKLVLRRLKAEFPRMEVVWADGAFAGRLQVWMAERRPPGVRLEIVGKIAGQKGFVPLPKRWVVERTFAWLDGYRALSKDYEFLAESSEAMIKLAMIHVMLRRITDTT